MDNLEEEINLLDFAIVILKRKWFIVSVLVVAFGLMNAILYENYVQKKRRVDTVECMIRTSIDKETFNSIILSHIFVGVFSKENTIGLLYPELWNNKEGKWLTKTPPSAADAYTKLKQVIAIKWEGENVFLSIKGENLDAVKNIMTIYVNEIVEYFNLIYIKNFDRHKAMINGLQKGFGETKDPALKKHVERKIMDLLITIRKEELINNKHGKIIEVLVPPYELTETKGDVGFFSKKYYQMVIAGVSIALILAVMLAFFMEYLQNLQIKYPEKVKKIKCLLK